MAKRRKAVKIEAVIAKIQAAKAKASPAALLALQSCERELLIASGKMHRPRRKTAMVKAAEKADRNAAEVKRLRKEVKRLEKAKK